MSNPNSPTLDEVIGNVVEEVLRERAEETQRESPEEESQETALEVMLEDIKVVVKEEEARAFYFNKGAEAFLKHLTNKGFVEERGFQELVSPFKEEIEQRG